MKRVVEFYNAARMGWWVFWWLFYEGEHDTVYQLVGINGYGVEQTAVLLGRGREAWRLSHLAIQAWKPKP